MGMYTEIFINCEIERSSSPQILNVLRYMFGDGEKPSKEELPLHALFMCDRWECIGKMSSYYFVPEAVSKFHDDWQGGKFIVSRSDLKNYDSEIEKFFEWIMPYIDAPDGQFIGYSRYEEDDVPKLYFKVS